MREQMSYSRFSATMTGALLVFLGAAMLANPGVVTVFVVRLVGFACVIFAAIMFAGHLMRAHALDAIPFGELAAAVALMVLGMVVVLFPTGVAKVFFSMLGILIVVSGASDVMRSRAMTAVDDQLQRMTLRVGIVTIAAGTFVALVPSAAVNMVPILCGVVLVIDGLSELYLALQMEF